MTQEIVLRDEAQAEFDEAFDFYEARRPGQGVRFATRVQEAFERIRTDSQRHAVVFADVRKIAVAKFPFRIFYRVGSTRIEVLAVFHTSRDPSIWKGRA